MRRYAPLLIVLVFLLAACREDKGLVGDSVRESATIIAPTQATIIPGCNAPELEAWFERVNSNVISFHDEALGYSAMTPDAVAAPISRLSDLRDQVNDTDVPECVGEVHGMLQTLMDTIIDSFIAYSGGQIDQATLITQVTQQLSFYDTDIKPKLDVAAQTLTDLQKTAQ